MFFLDILEIRIYNISILICGGVESVKADSETNQ